MANLMSACDAFQQAKEIDVKEEVRRRTISRNDILRFFPQAERAARQEIKEQQDAAYKASLEADRQKAELQERARQEEQVQLLAKERAAQNVIQEKVKEEVGHSTTASNTNGGSRVGKTTRITGATAVGASGRRQC